MNFTSNFRKNTNKFELVVIKFVLTVTIKRLRFKRIILNNVLTDLLIYLILFRIDPRIWFYTEVSEQLKCTYSMFRCLEHKRLYYESIQLIHNISIKS